MTISKKLFLMTALALNLGSLLNGSIDCQDQRIFNFAVTLSRQDDNNSKEVSQWLFEQMDNNDFDTSKVLLILDAPLTPQEKVNHLIKLQPNFLKKYASKLHKNIISPIISKTSSVIKFTAATAAIIATPAIFILSAETGANVAERCFGGLLIHWQ